VGKFRIYRGRNGIKTDAVKKPDQFTKQAFMSLQNSLAKYYVRFVFRDDGPFDSLKTQKELNVPDPPRSIAKRCSKAEIDGVRAFWIDKENTQNGVLVYLHGGAFYFGPVKEHWQYISAMCKRSGMAALVVDFRMAPQHPFPAAMDDIIRSVSEAGLPENWFFLGDSSGGGMAIAACFKLRELNRALPRKLVLMSPWVDATLTNPAIKLNEHEDPMMSVERLSNAAREYAVNDDPANPLISPLYGDIGGLPPTLIQMGTADLLLWDCRKFYLKCIDAGIDVQYEEYPDAFHDFMMLGLLPEARRALRSQAEFLTKV
jgi:epsilon-lactone hydrolase